jgi:hypothetical protein
MNQLIVNIKDKNKAALLLEFLKSLNYVSSVKQMDGAQVLDIPEEHKAQVRERIKNSKDSELLDWNNVKNNFDGI